MNIYWEKKPDKKPCKRYRYFSVKFFGRIFFLLILLLLFFVPLNSYPQETTELYAFDMQYACEGPRYRIFRVVDHNQAQLIDINTISKKDEELLHEEINRAIAPAEGNNKKIVGRDIELIFPSDQAEQLFHKKQGISTICYLYYFKGKFIGTNKFYVQQSQFILKNKDCINNTQNFINLHI